VNVSDPSGSSFLFSLINAYDRPFRLSLIDPERALCVHPTDGPTFGTYVDDADGNWVKFSNLDLMTYGKAANESQANWARYTSASSCGEYAYQIDEWAGVPPIDFDTDECTLAGREYFAAAEIEVYSI
jgi:hypothetical protein